MNTVLRFCFEDTDGCGSDVNVFVLTNDISNDLRNEIDDAIASYVDTVEDWQYSELIDDVLKSLGVNYTVITPITFNI